LCAESVRERRAPTACPFPFHGKPAHAFPAKALADGGGCMRLCPQPVGINLEMIFKAAKAIKDKLEDDR
jgi:hypothetical protein